MQGILAGKFNNSAPCRALVLSDLKADGGSNFGGGMRIALYHTPCLTLAENTSNGHLDSTSLSSADKACKVVIGCMPPGLKPY